MAKKEQNYYWEIISVERAKKLFEEGEKEIYQLFEDDTEALIQDENDLNQAIEWGNELALKNKILSVC